jgi:hypothetical protein
VLILTRHSEQTDRIIAKNFVDVLGGKSKYGLLLSVVAESTRLPEAAHGERVTRDEKNS